MTDVKDVGPLDWRVSIVDKSGRPSPEFQRRWNANRQNTALIGTITFGTGAPSGVPADGAEYADTSTDPFTLYIGQNGAWHATGSTGADPTAVAGPTAINGTATTYMRSDAAPAVQKMTTSVFGIGKPDGTTITSAGGVLSVLTSGGVQTYVGAGAPSALHNDGDIYFDSTQTPYQGYVQVSQAVPGAIPAIDGAPVNVTNWSGSSSSSITVSTSVDSKILMIVVGWELGSALRTLTSITSTSGLTFTRALTVAGNANTVLEVYTAPLTAALTSEVVSISLSGNIDDAVISAFGVKNLDPSIFDSDPSLPGVDALSGSHTTMSVTGQTADTNDLLLYLAGTNFNNSNSTPSPFTGTPVAVTNGGGSLWYSLRIATLQAASPLASATYTSPITGGSTGAVMAVFALRGTANSTTSVWKQFGSVGGGGGGGFGFSPPHVADFPTSLGTVFPTATDDSDIGLRLDSGPVTTGDAQRAIVKALPGSGDWNVEMRLKPTLQASNYNATGLFLYESSSNKAVIFGLEWGNVVNIRVGRLTVPTGFVSNPVDFGISSLNDDWFKVEKVGTTLNYYRSNDGKSWMLQYTEATNASFNTAPDSIGLGFTLNLASGPNILLSCPYWVQSF